MTIYSLDVLLFLFGTSLLFHVQFYLAYIYKMPCPSKNWLLGFPGGSVANVWEMVWSLFQKDHTCRAAAKPVHHSYQAREHNYWAYTPHLLKPECPRACAPQQEKLLQWESCALQLESRLHLPQLEKSLPSHEDSAQLKINKIKKLIFKYSFPP